MIIYVILFFILLISLLFSHGKIPLISGEKSRNVIFLFCVSVLTAVACLRAPSVGMDTRAYIKLFYNFGTIPWNDIVRFSLQSGYEIGYVAYSKILYALFPYQQTITVANSLLFAAFMYGFINKYSKDSVLSLFVYFAFGFYQTSFNIVSSLIAAMAVYYNLDAFNKKNKLKAIAVTLIAFLFHRASIILLILLFLEKIQLNKRRVAAMIVLASLLAVFYGRLLPYLRYLAPNEYEGYLENEYGDNGLILIFHVLIIVYLAVYTYILKSRHLLKHKKTFLPNTINWLVLLELLAFIVSLRASKFSRLAYMFTPAYFIFIPQSIDQVKGYFNRVILRVSIVAIIGLQFFVRLSVNNIANTIPYLSIFNY